MLSFWGEKVKVAWKIFFLTPYWAYCHMEQKLKVSEERARNILKAILNGRTKVQRLEALFDKFEDGIVLGLLMIR